MNGISMTVFPSGAQLNESFEKEEEDIKETKPEPDRAVSTTDIKLTSDT